MNEDNVLKGVINDGDIRRAWLKGATLESPIESYFKANPTYVSHQCDPVEAMDLITARVMVLPVVDHQEKVVGYYSFKEKEQFSNVKTKTVVVLGLGYVGLTLAVTLADLGFQVYGFDTNKELLKELEAKKSPFYENGLQKLLDFHIGRNLRLVSELQPGLGDIYIITVGTPLLKDNHEPNLDYVRKAAESVGKVLSQGNMVLLRSTIPVGCSREIVLPALEKNSGLKVGTDLHLAFTPERTAEGRALKELRTNPQIVAGFNNSSSEYAANFFNTLTHSIITLDTLEAGEICKLIDNSYRDHKFAFINQFAPLTEKLQLDLCELVDAVNFGYQRNEVPKPSPGVGGACLSKDPYILSKVFKRYDVDSSLILEARKVNEQGPMHVKNRLEALLKQAGKDINTAKIFLIGMAFKGEPETSDLRESTAVWFLNLLPNRANVRAYDPLVSDEDLASLEIKPVSLEDGFEGADAVVILNNHRSYQDINIYKMFAKMNRPGVFIDTWHIFDPLEIKQHRGILYGGVGNV